MSKKYEELARDIIKGVGGGENVNNVYHCQTRLRFTLADESKAEKDVLEQLEGVAKVMISSGVFQVVIGTHVAEVFEEIEKLVKPVAQGESTEPDEKKGIVGTFIDFISGSFMPIIPALSGAGMVKAVLALLMVFKLISAESQTYYILNFFSDAAFYFLPILLTYTSAQKLRCNPILAATVAGIMMHPNWMGLVAAGEPVLLFGVVPFTLASYTATVIPILIVVFVQSYVEKFLNKKIPSSVRIVFVPLLVFLIMGTLAMSVLGPIGTFVGGYLAMLFDFLSTNASWAPAVLVGGLLPIMVMFGLHTAVGPLGAMQMAELGFDSIFGPGCVCSNIAQATSALVVSLRTKDKKFKQIATSGSITAFMGITEPALYGVNLPKKYPLVASMIGGGLGGLYAGLTHTHRFATGSSGLPAVLLYIGDNTMTYFYNIIIALIITIVVTAVVTYVLSLKFEKTEAEGAALEETPIEAAPVQSSSCEVYSPMKGRILPLSKAKDEVFASEVLGKGVVIEAEDGQVVAPFNGTVATLFPTKHAVGIVSEDGAEILIHIGIDTVQLNGECFESYVEQGEKVKQGQLLVSADLKAISEKGYCTQIPVIITNTPQYSTIRTEEKEQADFGDVIMTLEK